MAAARRNRPEKRDRVTWDNGISRIDTAFEEFLEGLDTQLSRNVRVLA
jgi:hypothetical protein